MVKYLLACSVRKTGERLYNSTCASVINFIKTGRHVLFIVIVTDEKAYMKGLYKMLFVELVKSIRYRGCIIDK